MKNNVKIQTKWIMGDGIDEYGEKYGESGEKIISKGRMLKCRQIGEWVMELMNMERMW